MEKLSKGLLVLGIILAAYGFFSRFYGMPSVAMMRFRSISFIILGNTAFILSLLLKRR